MQFFCNACPALVQPGDLLFIFIVSRYTIRTQPIFPRGLGICHQAAFFLIGRIADVVAILKQVVLCPAAGPVKASVCIDGYVRLLRLYRYDVIRHG